MDSLDTILSRLVGKLDITVECGRPEEKMGWTQTSTSREYGIVGTVYHGLEIKSIKWAVLDTTDSTLDFDKVLSRPLDGIFVLTAMDGTISRSKYPFTIQDFLDFIIEVEVIARIPHRHDEVDTVNIHLRNVQFKDGILSWSWTSTVI